LCVCVGIDLLLFSLSLVIFSFLRHGWISHSHGQVVALSQGGRIFYYLLTGPYAWNLISSTKVRRTIRFSDRWRRPLGCWRAPVYLSFQSRKQSAENRIS
jgi:hypothetical protein